MDKDDEDFEKLNGRQKKGLAFIEKKFQENINTLYVADMGSGKTRVGCKVIKDHVKSKQDGGYVLVCAPSLEILTTAWQKELKECFGVDSVLLDKKNFQKLTRPNTKTFIRSGKKIFLITYSMLNSSSDRDGSGESFKNIEYFMDMPPSLLIFDEIHNVTNAGTGDKKKFANNKIENLLSKKKLYVTLEKLKDVKKKVAFTATPLVNAKEELKIVSMLLNPHIEFYDEEDEEDDKEDNDENFNEESFEEVKKKFIYYDDIKYSETKVEEWLVYLPLKDEEYETLKQIQKDSRVKKTDSKNKSKTEKSGGIKENTAVLQFLTTGKAKTKTKKYYLTKNQASTKASALKTILEHVPEDDKVIVYDYYLDSIDFLARQKWMKQYNPIKYDGRNSKEDSERHIEDFEKNTENRVLLATLKKSSEGLNLQFANHIIILTLPWSPKDVFQAFGRVKRYGQHKPVFLYMLAGEYSEDNSFEVLKEEIFKEKAEEMWEVDKNRQLPKEKHFCSSETLQVELGAWIDELQSGYIDFICELKKLISKTKDELEKIKENIKENNLVYQYNQAYNNCNKLIGSLDNYNREQKDYRFLICLCYALLQNEEGEEKLVSFIYTDYRIRTDGNTMFSHGGYLITKETAVAIFVERIGEKNYDIPDELYYEVVPKDAPIEKLRQALMKNQPKKKPAIVVVKKKHAIKPTQKTHHTTQQKN